MILKRPSVRLRVTLLVLVPLLFLAGLATYDIARSANSALALIRSKTTLTDIGPPVASLQQALAAERREAIVYFAQPGPAQLTALRQREAVTDHAVAQVTAATTSAAVRQDASAGGKRAIAGLRKDLAGLAGVRAGLAGHAVTAQQAFAAYSGMIAASYQLLEQAIMQDGNSTQVLPKIAVIELAISSEYLQQESALLDGNFADRAFPASAYQGFVTLVGAHRLLYAQSYSYLDQADRGGLNSEVSPQVARAVTALENRLVGAGPQRRSPQVRAATWNKDVATLSAQVQQAVGQALARLVAGARSQADGTLRGLYLTGGIGLAAIVMSLILSTWIAVGLTRQLRGLRDMALDLARVRLPALVQRLGAGEDVSADSQVPDLTVSTDEIGQVEAAFVSAERMAVEATIDQARMRRGVGDVFRNLARRSQSLLARQMMLIDTLERRATGPDDLESLFRIDHLTTRMRRHAESLIVLAGDLPERTFLEPVPFVDVLRAAAAEVEDYTRIRVTARSEAALTGPAVADVIHMLAEFMENATSFSPPTAEVRVTGSLVARGYGIDIEDRGLGMTEQELAAANARLAEPPTFDLSGSDRLGLHVAAQLAYRHGIRITLRESPYGGTTAIVLIPLGLVLKPGAPAVGADPRSGEIHGNGRVVSRGPAEPDETTGRHAGPPPAGPFLAPPPAGPPPAPAAPVPVRTGSATTTATRPDAGPAHRPPATTENGLPVRVRQQKTADPDAGFGLLASPPREDPALAPLAGPETDARSPDAAGRVMSAFWHGRTRGISAAEHGPGNGAERPADGGI
jgi:signal transduction histidine kinase